MSSRPKKVMTSNRLYRCLSPLAFICLLAIALLMVMNFGLSFTRQVLPPENVRIANISDNSLSVSWTTGKSTTGSLILSTQKNRFARSVEFFTCKSFGLKCHIIFDEIANPSTGSGQAPSTGSGQAPSTTHYVFLRNLLPDTAYYYRLASGGDLWKYDSDGVLLPSIKTAKTLASLSIPQPVYSYVYEAEGKTPVKGALVYVSLLDGKNRNIIKSQPLITYTDERGIWMMDLGNLRSFDLKKSAKASRGDLVFIKVIAGGEKMTGYFVDFGHNQFLKPTIIE